LESQADRGFLIGLIRKNGASVCGSLCGNGGTVVLEKSYAGLRRKTQCSDWIS